MATEVEQIERDMPDGSVQKGLAVRDDAKYADNSQAFLDAVNGRLVEVKDASGNIIQAAITQGDYTLQGILFGGFPSTDTNLLNMQYHFANGRIYLDGDTVNDPNDRWLINSRWYDSNPVGYSQSAYLPCRIQKFRIDPNRPRTHWRDNPVYNATMNIRYK
jgi:hypothetical protein